ncbi:MAG TPA: stage II sporulation protein M, partial [Chthoniobacteraceae bacterium]|nr:stage II sporulation protein M [Chthoniobacteraceae bacterium]
MIIDLPRFIASQRPVWNELETMLARVERDPSGRLSFDDAKHFHLLYQKVSADLGRIATFAAEPELRRYLESLTARAYAEIHETRERGRRFNPLRWFTRDFPRAFRRQSGAFVLSVVITIVGVVFGGFAVALDEDAKEAVLPGQFSGHLGDPARRVAEEEKATKDRFRGSHASFASTLMANNISVSIRAVAFGMTWGIGTMMLLFYNGVILGLVAVDYVLAGQLVFLLGWLLPHGV